MRSVCLIDNDAGVLSASALALSDAGYEVTTASSITAAIEIMRRKRPDVLVADLRLPGVGDCAVIPFVRGAFPDLPIIAYSGHQSLKPIALSLGARAFVSKPSRSAVMADCIEQVCGPN